MQYGVSGLPTGLRYGDCLAVLRLHADELGVTRRELPGLFAQVQVIEREFVTAVHEVAASKRHDRA